MAEPKFSTTGGANQYSNNSSTSTGQKKLPNLPYLPGDDPNYVAPLTNTALNVPGEPQQVQPQQNALQNQRNQAMSNILTTANQPQQPSQVQQSVNTQTQNLLNNPTQGWNGNQYKQTQLSNFDEEQAKLFEAMRQKFADTSGTGTFQKDALGNQLQMTKDRRTLGSDIDYENRDYQRQSLIDSLAQGRETEGMNQAVKTNVVDNLAKAIQSGEGEAQRAQDISNREDIQQYQTGERRESQQYQSGEAAKTRSQDILLKNMDTESQKVITTLQGRIEQGLQTDEQAWKSAEEAINRQQEIALQSNDINAAVELETLKSQLQEKYQQNRETFQNTQRELSQIYNTSERLDVQNYETNMKYLDNDLYAIRSQGDAEIEKQLKNIDAEIDEAKAGNDLERSKTLESYRAMLERDAADAAFEKTKEAMNLQSRIDEAMAQNNQGRVVELETLKANQQEEYAQKRSAEATIAAQKKFDYDWLIQNNEYSHEDKMTTLAYQLDEARAIQDFTREKQIMGLQANLEFEKMRTENSYDAAKMNLQAKINEASASKDFEYATALKKQDIDATITENVKDRAIELSELALKQDAFVYQQYEAMKATDPVGASEYLKAELDKKGISYNPVDAVEQAKKAVIADFEVTKEQWKVSHDGSLEGFNEFYNESMFGDKSQEDYINDVVSGQFNYQQLKADPNKMAAAKTNATPWDGANYKNKDGKNIWTFNTLPQISMPFKDGNGTYIRISEPTRKIKSGADYQQFQAINLDTGNVETFTANG
jgi:hypothetical protein